MQVVVRVDDVGWNPLKGEDRQDYGLKLAKIFHEAMGGAPYLAAVIPACLDDEGRAWIESKPEGLTVGMHGMTHERAGGDRGGEYCWRDKEQIAAMVEQGLLLIPGKVDHFVAPYNTYAEHLHEALAAQGVRYHWTQPEYTEAVPSIEKKDGYFLIPAWKPLYGCIAWPSGPEEKPLLERIPEIMKKEGRAVLTLHITWEASRGEQFTGVRWFVERYKNSIISPEEYLA